MQKKFIEAKKVLMEAEKICIISHRSPDGDAVGSNLALRYALEKMGKTVVSACIDPLSSAYLWMKDADKFVMDFDCKDFDVIVSVDCGAKKLIAFHENKPEIFEKPFVNFDHHESNDGYGSVNVVDPDACATAFIIFFFIRFAKWAIDKDTATALLCGLYFDTGSFMHSNVDEYVMKVASELMGKGANYKRIVKELFHTTPANKLRLWGRIMERAYVNEDGVTVSAVNKHDYKVCDANSKDTGGVIDFLNAVPGSKYCVLLSEDEKGLVKGSLRTQRDDVNLSEVAKEFGGGGHPKASGFGMPGRLEPQVSWKIVPENGAEAHGKDATGTPMDVKF
jgi:bifunctional oligoribonuclease and PAP phosphatase NrnA